LHPGAWELLQQINTMTRDAPHPPRYFRHPRTGKLFLRYVADLQIMNARAFAESVRQICSCALEWRQNQYLEGAAAAQRDGA
jgi:hypothetical protein